MWCFRSSRSDATPQPPRHVCVETLEARALMTLIGLPPVDVPPTDPPVLPAIPTLTSHMVTLKRGVLTITGTAGDDQITVREASRRFRRLRALPGARFSNFPGGAHTVQIEEPAEWLRRLATRNQRRPVVLEVGGGLGSFKVPASRVRSIVINAGGGNDTVTIAVRPERVSAEVHGGAGDDTLVRACGDNSLPAMTGGPGDDKFRSDAAQVTDLEPGEELLPRDCG